MMTSATLADLPPPPPGRTGWPWTEAPPIAPPTRPDGSPWPRISIVTPSFNQGQYIEETIRSILLQGYPNLEYFVMDGGSTDDSVEIINRYAPWIDHWESGPDGGQAAGINKALSLASGLWFHNVNSDDVLLPGVLNIVSNSNRHSEIVTGHVINFGICAENITQNVGISAERLLRYRGPNHEMSWHQPGTVMRTELIKSTGGYPEQFKYVFDLITTTLAFERASQVEHTQMPFVKFRVHKESKTCAWGEPQIKESIESRLYLSTRLLNNSLRRVAFLEASRWQLQLASNELVRSRNLREFLDRWLRMSFRRPILLFNRFAWGALKKYLAAETKQNEY